MPDSNHLLIWFYIQIYNRWGSNWLLWRARSWRARWQRCGSRRPRCATRFGKAGCRSRIKRATPLRTCCCDCCCRKAGKNVEACRFDLAKPPLPLPNDSCLHLLREQTLSVLYACCKVAIRNKCMCSSTVVLHNCVVNCILAGNGTRNQFAESWAAFLAEAAFLFNWMVICISTPLFWSLWSLLPILINAHCYLVMTSSLPYYYIVSFFRGGYYLLLP